MFTLKFLQGCSNSIQNTIRTPLEHHQNTIGIPNEIQTAVYEPSFRQGSTYGRISHRQLQGLLTAQSFLVERREAIRPKHPKVWKLKQTLFIMYQGFIISELKTRDCILFQSFYISDSHTKSELLFLNKKEHIIFSHDIEDRIMNCD